MTIIEAGIIAGGCVGVMAGVAVGGSHGIASTVGFGTGGLLAGAATGWLFALLLICLLSIVDVFWRGARKRPADPPGELQMRRMNHFAVRGTFACAGVSALAWAIAGWLTALVILMAAALTTALLAVAQSELERWRNS